MRNGIWILTVLLAIGLGASSAFAIPGGSVAVREALELAMQKSGREAAKKTALEGAEQTLTRSAAKFGNKALSAAGDGGLELIEATAKHGDDVMKFAVDASPAARRVLALNTDRLLPLARRVGSEALEIEAKAPGLAGDVFSVFGDDAGKIIARSVPSEDIPRLLKYAEKADSSAARKLLLESYQKEGKMIFERITPGQIVAGGLTASMLYGTHRSTDIIRDWLDKHPELAGAGLDHGINVFSSIFVLITILLMWRFRLLPWHHKASARKILNKKKEV